MSDARDSGVGPDDPQTPAGRLKPRRGAFPTPESVIEQATPYVPEVPAADDPAVAEPKESHMPADLSPKRGAIPSRRSTLAAAVPYAAPIGAPSSVLIKPQKISMWGNDVHGDCVTAEEAFAKACHNPEVFISDDEVIAWATKHGVLEGAVLTDVLTWMQDDGLTDASFRYDDGPYFSVNWTDPGVLRSAISRGPVKIGIAADQLETAWSTTGGQTGWFGTGWRTDDNEDHCVSLCGYGSLSWLAQQLGVHVPAGVDGTKPGYALFTWNSIGIVDVPSMLAVTQEAWLRQPTTLAQSLDELGSTLAFIRTSGTANGHVEVHLASGASGYLTRILQLVTTFADATGDTWQLLPNQDLALIQTSGTTSGHVEVHIASRASGYQTRTVQLATTFTSGTGGTSGTWQLLPNQDLALIQTSGTTSGHVEVHIASRASGYQTRTVQLATTFTSGTSGTWQLLPNQDLALIQTSGTTSGHVEVHIASRASGYQTRTVQLATTFTSGTSGTWQLLPNQDLALIATSGTASGHVEVHIASRASGYQARVLQLATTFTSETDGTWGILVP